MRILGGRAGGGARHLDHRPVRAIAEHPPPGPERFPRGVVHLAPEAGRLLVLVESEPAHRVQVGFEGQEPVEDGPEPLPPHRQHHRIEPSVRLDQINDGTVLHPPDPRRVLGHRMRGVLRPRLRARVHPRRVHLRLLGAGFEVHHHRPHRGEPLPERRFGELLARLGEPGGEQDIPLSLALGVFLLQRAERHRRPRDQHGADEQTSAAKPRM